MLCLSSDNIAIPLDTATQGSCVGMLRESLAAVVARRTPLMGNKPQKETGKMKASVLFGAGWENDSLEVLWRDAGRAFCRLWRDDAEGDRHV